MYMSMTMGKVWVCTQCVWMWTGSRRDSQRLSAAVRRPPLAYIAFG